MFLSIYLYELKYWLKKPSSYFYILIFSFVAFMYMAGGSDLFREFKPSNRLMKWNNSPFEINYIFNYFNKFFLFLLPAIIGASLYRDYNSETYKIMYSFPIPKKDYFLGKFLGALTMVFLIVLFVGVCFSITENLPGLNPAKLGDFNFLGYLREFAVFTLPNMLTFGLLVFAIISWTRNVFSGFGVIIGIFFFQSISESLFKGDPWIIALLDPLAKNTSAYATQYWGLIERNNAMIPIHGIVLYNRLLWFGLAAIIYALAFRSFKFHEHIPAWINLKRAGNRVVKNNFESHRQVHLPQLSFRFDWKLQLRNTWFLTLQNLKYILKSPIFYVMLGLAILSLFAFLYQIMVESDMALLPATRLILSFPSMFFKGIVIMITFLFSGILIHRERTNKINELVDITPISNSTFFLSKFLAILLMQCILLLSIVFSGLAIQIYVGYFNFEFDLYFSHLFGIEFIGFAIWTSASFLVHSFFKNTYLGLFVLLLLWMGSSNLNQIGIDTYLVAFNKTPFINYSDLNGFGTQLEGFFTIEFYWSALSVIFVMLSYLLWNRGGATEIKERLAAFQSRWTKGIAVTIILSSILMAGFGFRIYGEEQKNVRISAEEQQKAFIKFTEKFGHFAGKNQPRIIDVNLRLDLFPNDNKLLASGTYILKNKSTELIDTLLVKTGYDEISTIHLQQAHEVLTQDDHFHFYVIKLEKSLLPGETLNLDFELKNKDNNIFERYSSVLHNGTFLMQDIFPRVGYILDAQLKHPSDNSTRKNHAYASDSDAINFEAIISTNSDQKLFAPGHLLKEWTEGGRTYSHYKLNQAIKYSLGINSGKYESVQENYKGIEFEIHYHKGHGNNLDLMMNGLKASYDYNTKYFGSYQHDQARIIEFPQSEGTHATTYANNIPMSEVRFLTSINKEEESIDIAFYVPAHELTHQWWGAQIVPAAAFGSRMLSESVTEYITLRIYEKQYGKQRAINFLKEQRERYLKSKRYGRNAGGEPPLSLVRSNQKYIFYGKGSMAFNTLSYYLGEEKLNSVLSSFLNANKFKEAPYPTSLDLIDSLKINTPDSIHYLIADMFESVRWYENKIGNAKYEELSNGKFEVTLDLIVVKKEDEKEENLDLNDLFEFGFYDENGLIKLIRRKINKEESTLIFILNQKPNKVVLDPNILTIDLDLEDNEISL